MDEVLDDTYLVEEESTPGYKAEDYYLVRIGELFHDRYKVIGKLGFGTTSTVWLCHDRYREDGDVALKVYINTQGMQHSGKVNREVSIYEHINSINSKHYSSNFIRKLLDHFEITGPDGKHTCLVHEALGMSMDEYKDVCRNLGDGDWQKYMSSDVVRPSLRDILRGLHFLHTDAHVVHTDIQPGNVLWGIPDDAKWKLARFEQEEREAPFPRKVLPSCTIYLSRRMSITTGNPKLADLSAARFDGHQNVGLAMPNLYRAPEVILDMPWSYPVDLWGYAMMLWDLFEPRRLFDPCDEDGQYSEHLHLAQMISIMGPPPLDFLQRSEYCHKYWDSEGKWLGDVPIPETSLETTEQRLQGEEKEVFLIFMRKMLQWKPEDRSDIEDIYMDEWLLADLIEAGEVVRDEQEVAAMEARRQKRLSGHSHG